MKKLILMRGVPGSGKSTWARHRVAHYFEEENGRSAVICSTDDRHMIDGEYVFQPEKLGSFHTQTQLLAELHMRHGIEFVVIDNTNIKRRDMKPYKDLAEMFGYEVEEIIVGEDRLCPSLEDACPHKFADYVDLCAKRNTHGVPRDVIEKMARSFQR